MKTQANELFLLPELPTTGPFKIVEINSTLTRPRIRSIQTNEGIGDRLRVVAFAELQAKEAFHWAARTFQDQAPEGLSEVWNHTGNEEGKHLSWLLERMKELGVDPAERELPRSLWYSLVKQKTPYEFASAMAFAEERGRIGGLSFEKELKDRDPRTAKLFAQIASEEAEHIALFTKFFLPSFSVVDAIPRVPSSVSSSKS